jgi:DNA-binding transcriptional regulator YiaG
MTAAELKELRKTLGLSAAKAAAQVHVSERSWHRWEAGDRSIPESVVHLF